MTEYPAPIRRLVSAFRQLPAIGPRSAERLALHLLKSDPGLSLHLSEAIQEARTRIHRCRNCGFYAEEDTCAICRDPARDTALVCVVEQASDVLTFEKTGTYRGLYHVLHGTLSPLDGIGPEELGLPRFFQRLTEHPVREVILGLNPDVKGETTSLYLADELKKRGLRVTRLATGISVGGGLEFVDALTLGHAIEGRKDL